MMKKPLLISLSLLFVIATLSPAQSDFAEARGDHYLVRSQLGTEHAERSVERLEAFAVLYNEQFRFDMM